ncbi:hypothetical protein GCM10023063_14820 [Arthrobacter methylotrophus]|uniref:Metallophosphoesterase n=1 Tax=Arthrobacter methylotrophus TaxID=121291 RepID=A0ABV5UMZ7_9MICC
MTTNIAQPETGGNPEILIAGDWHGRTSWMVMVLRKAARSGHRTVIHVGDLAVLWPAANDKDKFTKALARRLEEHGLTLIFIDGNHDVHPKLRALPVNEEGFGVITDRLLYAPRGHRWQLGGVRFGALGGAYSVDRRTRKLNSSWWIGEETSEADVLRLGHGSLDVLITHEVPAGIDVVPQIFGELPEFIEREAYANRLLVRDAVRNTEPKLVFSGHWHQRRTGLMPNMDTRVHVLHRDLFEGNVVALDLDTLTVREYPLG